MSFFIGSVIGLVMGLTGAGGALVAIPLFIEFLGMTLKEASVYSLLAVVVASLSNFYHQRTHADFKLSLGLIVFSGIGSILSAPYKALLPDFLISILLAIVSLYSLYSVWRPLTLGSDQEKNQKKSLFKTSFIGLFLGGLTTFTGLGGGVLMLPILLNIYKMPQKNAVATSLIVVGVSSLISFTAQLFRAENLVFDNTIVPILIGVILISYVVKLMISKLSQKALTLSRQIIFTVVVLLALLKIF